MTEALQQYLEKTEVPRERIENDEHYAKKKEQWERHRAVEAKREMERYWNEANVSQMKNFPANTILRELIREKLADPVFILECCAYSSELDYSDHRPLTKEESQKEARLYVRKAWKEVMKDISARIGKKLEQFAAAGRAVPGDKDAARKLEREARLEVLREITAEHEKNGPE